MTADKNSVDFFRQALSAINMVEAPITYQDYINNKETTTEAVDKSALKAWHNKYKKYQGNNGDELPTGMLLAYIDTGILTDGVETNEFADAVEKLGGDRDEAENKLFSDEQLFSKLLPITDAMQNDYMKAMGVSEIDEDNCNEAAKILGDDVVGFGVAEDSEYDADMAPEKDHDDHEVNMAKSDMFKAMGYAKDIYTMLERVSEQEGIEGWVSAKLTKAADYLSSVKHYIEHEMAQANMAGESEMDEKAPPGREKQVKKLKKKFDDPGAPYAIAWAQHNKHGKPNKESIGESTMTDKKKIKLNEGIRIQTDSLEDSIALMTILKNAGLDPQQMNIQAPSQDMTPAPDMDAPAPDMDAPAPDMDAPEEESFANAPDEKMLDKDDYELKRNKVKNADMGPSAASRGDNPLPEDADTEEVEEAKPDFLDLDKDGDKKEPMKKAAKDKEKKKTEDIDDMIESLNKQYELMLIGGKQESLGLSASARVVADESLYDGSRFIVAEVVGKGEEGLVAEDGAWDGDTTAYRVAYHVVENKIVGQIGSGDVPYLSKDGNGAFPVKHKLNNLDLGGAGFFEDYTQAVDSIKAMYEDLGDKLFGEVTESFGGCVMLRND